MVDSVDKMETWREIILCLNEIESMAEQLDEALALDGGEISSEFETIKENLQKIRSAAHGLIRPDLED